MVTNKIEAKKKMISFLERFINLMYHIDSENSINIHINSTGFNFHDNIMLSDIGIYGTEISLVKENSFSCLTIDWSDENAKVGFSKDGWFIQNKDTEIYFDLV